MQPQGNQFAYQVNTGPSNLKIPMVCEFLDGEIHMFSFDLNGVCLTFEGVLTQRCVSFYSVKLASANTHYIPGMLLSNILNALSHPWLVCFFCRWRDVKLRAFDNAKHRTYVDLKV